MGHRMQPRRGTRIHALICLVSALGSLVYFKTLVRQDPGLHREAAAVVAGDFQLNTKYAADKSMPECPHKPTFVQVASWADWHKGKERSSCHNLVPQLKANGTVATLPLFLILGEQKCGTTFLRTLLAQHPLLRPGTGIYGREGGETHFFDWAMRLRGVPRLPEAMMQHYSEYFTVSEREAPRFNFDTSPSYFAWPGEVPQLVKLVLPRVRMVVLIRDPVERYESALRMALCRSQEAQDAEPSHKEGAMADYIRRDPLPLHLTRGLYKANLDRWLSEFGSEQLLVVESADLFRSPQAVAQGVLDFLGLPPAPLDVTSAVQDGQNKGCRDDYRLAPGDRRVLQQFYAPHNQDLEKFLRRRLGWS